MEISVLYYAGITLAFLYFVFITYFIFGWISGKEFFSSVAQHNIFTSIIISVRNEEKNIENIMHDLSVQKFPQNLFEILIVDDHSEDGTSDIISRFTNVRKIRLEKNIFGKKNAISLGIQQSKGDLIITLDVDCRVGEKWLETVVSFYEKEKPEMIIAPVCLNEEKSVFGKMQSLEFLSLMGVTAASAFLKNPLMCNGANLAYTKKSFFDVNGFSGNEKSPSGDDIFLLEKFKKNFSGKIKFLKSKDAVAFTSPEKNLNDFLQQRKRWASKNRHYSDFSLKTTALFVLLFNFSILLFGILSFFYIGFAEILLLVVCVKFSVDLLFLFLTASFFKRKSLLCLYVPVQILYIFYVPCIAFLSINSKFIWKNRQYFSF